MIQGYAAVFFNPQDPAGTEFDLGGGYVERFMPSAFDEVLKSGADVVALLNHDQNLILGRRSSNTLTLEVDSKGLRYSIPESTTQVYRDVATWQGRGELRGSSIGFVVKRQVFSRDGEKRVREIHNVILMDVGPVTFPAYSGTEGSGILRRCVSISGRCEAVPIPVAGECRSAITAGLDTIEREREAVRVRARVVQVDTR